MFSKVQISPEILLAHQSSHHISTVKMSDELVLLQGLNMLLFLVSWLPFMVFDLSLANDVFKCSG